MRECKVKIRAIERDGNCRGCDKSLSPGDLILYNYSYRGNGTTTIFCIDCVKVLKRVIEEWENENEQ